MNYHSIFLFLLFFISVLSLEKADKNVEYIEKEDVEDYVTNHPLVLVHWYNSWCTFCKDFAPKWNNLSDLAVNAENEFKLIKVEIGDENDFKNLYEISQVPDFGVFVNGEYSHFHGNKEPGDILHFVSNHTSDGTIKINHVDQLRFLKDKSNAIIIGLVEEGSEEERIFKNNVLRDDNSLYTIPSANVRKQLMEKYELSIPSLLIYKSFDEMIAQFTEEFTDEKVHSFIHQHNHPVVYPTKNPRYKNHIYQHGNEWMTMLIDKDNAKYPSALSNRYLEICKNNRQTVCFYIGKSEKMYYDFYTEGRSIQFPAIITVRKIRGFYFKHYFPPIQKMSTEEISLYLHNVISGVIKPEYQSDKIPLNDLPYLQTVVGSNFEEEVMKSKEDVVIQFYSDACDHCSKMMKRFEKVASVFAEDASIRFMKFSTNTNDIDVEGIHAYHYHSILYIHKGEKTEIVEYPRSRKVWRTKALSKWILSQKERFSVEKEEEEL